MTQRLIFVVIFTLALAFAAFTVSPYEFETATQDVRPDGVTVGDAYLVGPPTDVAAGDTLLYWDPQAGEFDLLRVDLMTPEGYVPAREEAVENAADETAAMDGRPPVPQEFAVAEVVTLSGRPVFVPGLGALVPFVRTYGALFVAFGLGLLSAYVAWTRTLVHAHARERLRGRRLGDVQRTLLVFVFVTSLAVTPLTASTHQLTLSENMGSSVRVVGTGDIMAAGEGVETAELTRRSPLGMHYVVDTDSVTVQDWTVNETGLFVTFEIPRGPDAVAQNRRYLSVYPYLPTLPFEWVQRLHAIHPLLAIVSTSLVFVVPLWIVGLVLDPSRPIRTTRT